MLGIQWEQTVINAEVVQKSGIINIFGAFRKKEIQMIGANVQSVEKRSLCCLKIEPFSTDLAVRIPQIPGRDNDGTTIIFAVRCSK